MAADFAPAPPTCASLAEELAATQEELRRVRKEVDSLRRTVEPLTGMQMKVDQLMYALTLAQKLYKHSDNQRPERAKRMAKKATSAASKAATCASPDCCSDEAAESGASVEAEASEPAVPVTSAKPQGGEDRGSETCNPTSPQAKAKGSTSLTPLAPAPACPAPRSPPSSDPLGPRLSPRTTLKSKRRDDHTPPPTVECRVVQHGPDVGDRPAVAVAAAPLPAFAPGVEPLFHVGTSTPPKASTKPLPLDATPPSASAPASATRGKKNKGRKKKGGGSGNGNGGAAAEAQASTKTVTPADVDGSPSRGIFLFGSPVTPSTPASTKDTAKDTTTPAATGAGAFSFSTKPSGSSPFASPSSFPFGPKPGERGVPVTSTWYLPKTATSPAITATATVLFGHSSPLVPFAFPEGWGAGGRAKEGDGKGKDNPPPLVK